jgi:hypothetical protein
LALDIHVKIYLRVGFKFFVCCCGRGVIGLIVRPVGPRAAAAPARGRGGPAAATAQPCLHPGKATNASTQVCMDATAVQVPAVSDRTESGPAPAGTGARRPGLGPGRLGRPRPPAPAAAAWAPPGPLSRSPRWPSSYPSPGRPAGRTPSRNSTCITIAPNIHWQLGKFPGRVGRYLSDGWNFTESSLSAR